MQLSGRRVVITGGGRGIGASVARMAAEAGASVVVSARSVEQIESVAASLRDAGYPATAIPCDVADPDQVGRLRDGAIAAMGGVDVLVNNAGIASSAPLDRVTLEVWNQTLAVNATGTFLCTQAFLPDMVAAGWGRVVNVASIAGKVGGAYMTAYAASKHAVLGFTRALSAEVARTGVTVNAVCPGFVDTDMTVDSVARIVSKTSLDDEAARQRLAAFSPQGRIFHPDEVAFLVLSLCDELAGGIHGQGVVLDGGSVQS